MRRVWTTEDINFLEEYIGFYKIQRSQKMESYESVRVKMNRLELSNTKSQTGYVTIGELASLLKVEEYSKRVD